MQRYDRNPDEIASEKAGLKSRIDDLAAVIAKLKDLETIARKTRQRRNSGAVVLPFHRRAKKATSVDTSFTAAGRNAVAAAIRNRKGP